MSDRLSHFLLSRQQWRQGGTKERSRYPGTIIVMRQKMRQAALCVSQGFRCLSGAGGKMCAPLARLLFPAPRATPPGYALSRFLLWVLEKTKTWY